MDDVDVVLDHRTAALEVAGEVDAMADQLAADLPHSPQLATAVTHLRAASQALGGVR